MPRRKDYPEDIDLKVEERVGGNGLPTEKSLQAARILKEEWPAQFNDLAKDSDFSRTLFSDVLYDYFGPPEHDIRFREIYDEYGSIDEWERARQMREQIEEEITSGDAPNELPDWALDMYDRIYDRAYDRAFSQGVKTGYEIAKNEVEPCSAE